MTPLFKKLNYKNHTEIIVLNAPESFKKEVEKMEGIANFKFSLDEVKEIEFVIAFTTKQSEVDHFAESISVKLKGDAVVWFAYPKGSSKKYKCEFNRDKGWAALGKNELEPVRMVAIDEDWSALRFRKVDFIKTMSRAFAMTEKGKEKAQKSKKGA